MTTLIAGVMLWSVAHLLPSAGQRIRKRAIERIGEGPYKGLFALTIVSSIVLMVLGWRAAPYVSVFAMPAWGHWAAESGMLISCWLLFGVGMPGPSNVKRLIRHPQLVGVAVWSGSHLLANGDGRSVVLFLGIGAWSLLAMLCINRRDGDWDKPEPVPLRCELRPLSVGLAASVAIFLAHPYFTGVTLPRPW